MQKIPLCFYPTHTTAIFNLPERHIAAAGHFNEVKICKQNYLVQDTCNSRAYSRELAKLASVENYQVCALTLIAFRLAYSGLSQEACTSVLVAVMGP